MKNRTGSRYFVDDGAQDRFDQYDKIEKLSELTHMCTSPSELIASDSGACEENLLAKMKKNSYSYSKKSGYKK